jgi:hypothetical protein
MAELHLQKDHHKVLKTKGRCGAELLEAVVLVAFKPFALESLGDGAVEEKVFKVAKN